MVTNAAKHDVEDAALVQEIQQLGLPKENSDMIVRQYREHKDALRAKLASSSYRIGALLSTDWRVDSILAPIPATVIHLNLHIDKRPDDDKAVGKYENLAFELSSVQLDGLVRELGQVLIMMQSLDT